MTPRDMSRRVLAASAAVVLAAGLSACSTWVTTAPPSAASHAHSPAARPMTVPEACRYLHLDHDGQVPFPGIAALGYVAAHMSPASGSRALGAIAGKVAGDEQAHSLRHLARIGPDFATLMDRCSQVSGGGH